MPNLNRQKSETDFPASRISSALGRKHAVMCPAFKSGSRLLAFDASR